jgi:uncharacterized protein with NRDE domain
MCTVILLDRVVPGIPVVVGANRDEYLDRPAAPPALFRSEAGSRPSFVAPHDLEAGGTWMGVNAHGLFAGLTNRPVERKDTTRRSRGLLVVDALRCASAEGVPERLGADLARRYNPFQLLVADGRRTVLTRVDAQGACTRALPSGVHVVGNLDEGDAASTKLSRIREGAESIDVEAGFERIFGALVALLSDHGDASRPYENACVHLPGYGTRSAAVIALGDARRSFWAAEGPPCQAKFHDHTRLLDALHAGAPSEEMR